MLNHVCTCVYWERSIGDSGHFQRKKGYCLKRKASPTQTARQGVKVSGSTMLSSLRQDLLYKVGSVL